MNCFDSRAIGNLMSAREAGRDHQTVLVRADFLEQHALADLLADVEMVVPERPRHAAAAGIDFAHGQAGDQAEGAVHRARSDESLLLAVSVHERGFISRREVEPHVSGLDPLGNPAAEQKRILLHLPRRVGGDEVRVLVDQRQQTAWLVTEDRHPLLDESHQPIHVRPRERSSLLDEPLRNEWPAAAPQAGEFYRVAGSFEQFDRRDRDVRLAE